MLEMSSDLHMLVLALACVRLCTHTHQSGGGEDVCVYKHAHKLKKI